MLLEWIARQNGHMNGVKMLLKVALVVAVTSWVIARYMGERKDEAGLTREVEGQLQALRDELFRR